MVAQQVHLFRQHVVIGDDRPAVAERAEVLGREEREATQIAHGAGPAALVFGADGLGRIFDHYQAAALCDRQDRVHFGTLTEQVHRHDGAGARADLTFDLRRVDIESRRIDIDKHRPRPQPGNRAGGGKERVRRGDDFVAWLNIDRHQGDQQCIRSGRHTDAKLAL